MLPINLYNAKQAAYARHLYTQASDTSLSEIERQRALQNYEYFRLCALRDQLDAYKQHDKNELVIDSFDNDFSQTVAQTIKEIAIDIIDTKRKFEISKAIYEYLEGSK